MSNALPNHIPSIYANRVKENPFPGLRPFHANESHLFFGREGQLDEVLGKLEKHKFIAILGTSGSGKSSFMYCGLLPSLSAGFMNNASSHWRMVVARPGIAPLQNLAEALIKSDNEPLTEEDFFLKREYYTAALKSSSLGLLELCKQKRKRHDEQILLLVDQFEELFRFINAEENFLNRSDDSLAYVRLLIRVLQQSEIPIYVVMTMRSDYIGDCARFPDLTAYINKSHYLIPQMTREQKRTAILGPIAVSGAKITHRLVQQLLNDLGDNQDQLPIMQHALMRTWNYWVEHALPGEPLDIQHYEAIGTMTAALSIHAKEAFDELTEHQKFICEKIFKSITEKGTDGRGIRRPTKLKYIAQIVGVSIEEVRQVVEIFRKPGRTLLTPMPPAELLDETVIDISHESLMRIWETLREWVEEEAESVKMYLRLADAAHAYQLGRARLWRPPDLLVAMNWREKNKPNLAWAQRHEPAFERAIVFLETSQHDYEEEQRIKDRAQKERLRKSRYFAFFMTMCVILAICMVIYSYTQKLQAERSEQEAILQRLEAEKQSIEANKQRAVSLYKQREAQEQKIIAENQRKYAEAKAIEVLNQKRLIEKALLEVQKQEALARINEQRALQQSKIAEQQTLVAEQNALKAEAEGRRAMQEEAKANRLRFLSLSQSMAVKSLQFKDPETKSVLAQQAYNFNDEYQGNPYNPDVFAGLYYAEKALEGTDFNSLKGHTDAVRALTFDNNGKRLFTAGSDNKILVWDIPLSGKSKPKQINGGLNHHIFRNIEISPNGKLLAVGTDDSYVQLYNATTLAFIDEIKVHRQGGIVSLIFSPDGKGIITAGGDNIIKYTDVQTLQSYNICTEKEKIRSLAALNGTAKIAYILRNTAVKVCDITANASPVELFRENTKDEGSAIAVSNEGKWLTAGFQSGKLQIWNLAENKPEAELLGHDTWISNIKFSRPKTKDGVSFLASASFDGTAKVWIVGKWDDAPIVLNDHTSWVWSVAFSPDALHIVTGCVDDVIRVYPTDMEEMSKRVCEKLPRNMTEKEWKRFVGEDVRYQPTCKNNP